MSDELNAASAHDEAPEPRAAVWRRMVCSGEGKVFFVGVLVLALYVGGLLMVRRHSVDDFNKLWTMTTTHVLAGRAAGLSLGYQQKLTPRVAIFCNIVIETFMVMIFYPLFVFCYHRLIVFQPLEDAMERAHHVAETHRETIAKFGVPGLLGFVLLPFWMTGPLVGSVIGFIIGLRPWANMAVVLSGTYIAILCWGIALQHIHDWLEAFGYYVPFAFVSLILATAVFVHLRYTFARRTPRASDPPDKQA
jgi:uncharacterized membrane protein